jgi:anti-anti-sigma regulatory factor
MEIVEDFHQDRRVMVISIIGKLCLSDECRFFEEQINRLLSEGLRLFIIDFSDCSELSRDGLYSLQKLHTKVNHHRGRFKFCCLQPDVYEFLNQMLDPGFNFVFGAWPTLKEAVEHFQVVSRAI